MTGDQAARTVRVATDLYEKISERARGAGFASVDEYVTFVLEAVLEDEAEDERPTLSKEEEEEVKRRLRDLGYLD